MLFKYLQYDEGWLCNEKTTKLRKKFIFRKKIVPIAIILSFSFYELHAEHIYRVENGNKELFYGNTFVFRSLPNVNGFFQRASKDAWAIEGEKLGHKNIVGNRERGAYIKNNEVWEVPKNGII